ncbi:MAG TPA: hypothetical protein VK277_01655 [Acidimicrobiales bacterium]|nr:hypothetical protein [Acidimicrobiales bacterium]
MTFLKVLAVLFGLAVVGSVLVSALETVVLPRQGFTRIARLVFGLVHRVIVVRHGPARRQDRRRSLFAPIALVSLPLAWMLIVTIGFAFIFWGFNIGTWSDALDVSGSSLFTLGFSKPPHIGQIWLTFIEATIGLGLVALLISYLPTIYEAYNARERGISVLRPFAGTPPSSAQLLRQLVSAESVDSFEIWNRMANWLIDLEGSHSAFPALCYYPVRGEGQSWVATAGTILDAAVGMLALGADEDRSKMVGPLLVVTYGSPALVRIGRSVGLPLDPPTLSADLMALGAEPPPEVSVRREEFDAWVASIGPLGLVGHNEPERAWYRYSWLRSGYDQALRGLAGLTGATPAPLTTDRPAWVGRPPLFGHRPLHVDWTLVR